MLTKAPPPQTAARSRTALPAVIVAGVFAVAVIGKLYDPATTVAVFEKFIGMPAAFAKASTVGLVALEAGLAAWLLIGIARRAAFATAGGLLLVFTGLIVWQHLAGWTGGCGCAPPVFGHGGDRVVGCARNLACLGLCGLGLRRAS